ncbi:T9SS type A sorting domain-containing protein [uncultured Flavobacterium sp.]|uniref:T9SS type A sorting domain-containing protein n=1 Tax=uncultured Flavobacterium sp. TaxID=165435 RepID=UPI0025CDC74F|nr:T9SS type A sorting domain-containing protein [uncultured Flavobacterium sp.]
MKKNYQKCINVFFLMLCVALTQHSGYGNGRAVIPAAYNTPCAGMGSAASEGAFSTGYSYVFSTTGTMVNVSVTMLDTDKDGVVAYVRTQDPFSETGMQNAGNLTFTGVIENQVPGATINIAVKFAFAGGLAVTQYIPYVVGENCTGGSTDTQSPTAFTASVGTVTPGSVQLLLNASDDSGNVTYTVAYGTSSATFTGTSGTQLPVVINNLSAATAYSFSITAADAAGNAAANNPIVLTATTTQAPVNTPCAGTGTAASEGAFSTGYSYVFSTTGTTVNVSVTMLDTDKDGVVAYVRTQDPFSETGMQNAGNLTFTGVIENQLPGATINIAVKFAFAGGLAVTQYIPYVVGENCTGGGADTEAPTGFTAVLGTVTATSAELILNGTDNSGSVTYTITYGAETETVTVASGEEEIVLINGLTPETAYSFSITATDAAGNAAANSPIVVTATTPEQVENEITPCSGTNNAAQDGTFSTGYSYEFETVGNNVHVIVTMLDADKDGVVAFLWQQTPFAETQMANAGGLTFTGQLEGQAIGSTINIAIKFAYVGGLSVTQYIPYVVGENCNGGEEDTEAPTGLEAGVGAVTATSIELELTATDNSGEVIYTVTYEGGTPVTVTGTSGEMEPVVINNLSPGTTYTFTITATDAAGNAVTNVLLLEAETAEDTNTECEGMSTAAQEGAFTTGYTYHFETVDGNVVVTFDLLDTDKTGVVALVWQQTPFTETEMLQGEGLSFSASIPGLTLAQDVNLAVKFAYSGGQAVTQYFTYTVGESCEMGVEVPEFASNVKLYPNPAISLVTLDMGNETLSKATIYSLTGRKVIESNSKAINIESLSAGVYLVHIQSGDKLAVKKLIIE